MEDQLRRRINTTSCCPGEVITLGQLFAPEFVASGAQYEVINGCHYLNCALYFSPPSLKIRGDLEMSVLRRVRTSVPLTGTIRRFLCLAFTCPSSAWEKFDARCEAQMWLSVRLCTSNLCRGPWRGGGAPPLSCDIHIPPIIYGIVNPSIILLGSHLHLVRSTS
jgi:hypothetical protein